MHAHELDSASPADSSSVVNQEFWHDRYSSVTGDFDEDRLGFRDIFDQYFTPGGTCFEVGCYPGRFLAYLCNRFGYTANGIDWTPFVRTRMPAFLSRHGVRLGEFFCEDFEKFRCGQTFDLVYSLGFIEHFSNLEEIIRRHIELVKVGGTLFLSCPNFRGLQFFFHRIFDTENLRAHVTPTMNLARWRRVLEASGMEILRDGYYRTVGFWTSPESTNGLMRSVSGSIAELAERLDPHFDAPNRWVSPHMFSVSRKVR